MNPFEPDMNFGEPPDPKRPQQGVPSLSLLMREPRFRLVSVTDSSALQLPAKALSSTERILLRATRKRARRAMFPLGRPSGRLF